MPNYGAEMKKKDGDRINNTFSSLKSRYEKFLEALLALVCSQHAATRASGKNDTTILDGVGSIRQALFKFSLRYLALALLSQKLGSGSYLIGDKLLQNMVKFLNYEATGQSASLLYLTLRSDGFVQRSSLMAYEYISCS